MAKVLGVEQDVEAGGFRPSPINHPVRGGGGVASGISAAIGQGVAGLADALISRKLDMDVGSDVNRLTEKYQQRIVSGKGNATTMQLQLNDDIAKLAKERGASYANAVKKSLGEVIPGFATDKEGRRVTEAGDIIGMAPGVKGAVAENVVSQVGAVSANAPRMSSRTHMIIQQINEKGKRLPDSTTYGLTKSVNTLFDSIDSAVDDAAVAKVGGSVHVLKGMRDENYNQFVTNMHRAFQSFMGEDIRSLVQDGTISRNQVVETMRALGQDIKDKLADGQGVAYDDLNMNALQVADMIDARVSITKEWLDRIGERGIEAHMVQRLQLREEFEKLNNRTEFRNNNPHLSKLMDNAPAMKALTDIALALSSAQQIQSTLIPPAQRIVEWMNQGMKVNTAQRLLTRSAKAPAPEGEKPSLSEEHSSLSGLVEDYFESEIQLGFVGDYKTVESNIIQRYEEMIKRYSGNPRAANVIKRDLAKFKNRIAQVEKKLADMGLTREEVAEAGATVIDEVRRGMGSSGMNTDNVTGRTNPATQLRNR